MQNRRTEQLGILYGLLGVILFSLTLPMTKIALPSFSASFIAVGRAFLASLLAGFFLWLRREPLPSKSQLKSLIIIALGVIFGFPILSALAMNYVPASHGAIVLALLPLATAGMAVLRAGERPSILFWISSIVGCATVLIYSFQSSVGDFHLGDLLLLGAVLSAALGYAEGGALSQEMPGWKVISWALVISSPLLLILTIWQWDPAMLKVPTEAWMSFLYLALLPISRLFPMVYRSGHGRRDKSEPTAIFATVFYHSFLCILAWGNHYSVDNCDRFDRCICGGDREKCRGKKGREKVICSFFRKRQRRHILQHSLSLFHFGSTSKKRASFSRG